MFSAEQQGVVLTLFGRASILDGEQDSLVICRADPTRALGPRNCALLTLAQAERLASLRDMRAFFGNAALHRLHEVRATVVSAKLLLAVEPGGVTTGAPPRVRVALAGSPGTCESRKGPTQFETSIRRCPH